MRKRILAMIGAFIISINFICSTSITAYATVHGGGGVSRPADKTSLNMFNEWSLADKAMYFRDNLLSILGGAVGIVFNPMNWDYSYISDQLQQLAYDCHLITESEDYWDWVANCLSVNDEGELVVNDELSDLMYQATNVYIEEKCGWYVADTINYRDIPASFFNSKGLYDAFIGYCTQNIKATDKVFYIYNFNSCETIKDDNGNNVYNYYTNATKAYDNVEFYVGGAYTYSAIDWETLSPEPAQIYADGNVKSLNGSVYSSILQSWNYWYLTTTYLKVPITDGVRTVRIYKTLEDLKNYSVGQRPYYVTDKFQDYDINGDNSCILSESDLSNGSVYGDVYNYIINNYDNPDGLTEDELRDILDDYFNNSGGGSGSSGNGSGSGSSGNGLMDFLGGLGSIGDAILSILGKLMEYIGKALDLISGTVTKVIDIIPKNITALLGALFPFFPEEWLTAIELGLVLAVIVGIVGLFKK